MKKKLIIFITSLLLIFASVIPCFASVYQLPSGYSQCEYIYSKYDTYCDISSISKASSSLTIEVDVILPDTSGISYICCGANGSHLYGIYTNISSNGISINFGNENGQVISYLLDNSYLGKSVHLVFNEQSTHNCYVNSINVGSLSNFNSYQSNIWLFGYPYSYTTSNNLQSKIESVVLIKNDIVIGNLVPIYNSNNSKYGFYNTINQSSYFAGGWNGPKLFGKLASQITLVTRSISTIFNYYISYIVQVSNLIVSNPILLICCLLGFVYISLILFKRLFINV